MKTSIYLGKETHIFIGGDLCEGVAPEISCGVGACTIFIDTETGKVVIDTNHTIPYDWKSGKKRS